MTTKTVYRCKPCGRTYGSLARANAHVAEVHSVAGRIALVRSRSTGGLVGLYDGEAAGLDTDGGRWQTVCEGHSTICSHTTLALARSHLAAPEGWCEDCMAGLPFDIEETS